MGHIPVIVEFKYSATAEDFANDVVATAVVRLSEVMMVSSRPCPDNPDACEFGVDFINCGELTGRSGRETVRALLDAFTHFVRCRD